MRDTLHLIAWFIGGDNPLTQRDLAVWLGVTQPTLSAWSTGRFKPTEAPMSLIELAMKVGMERADLLIDDDPGVDGFHRLVEAVGFVRAVKMAGASKDTKPVRRLAWLVEVVKQHAPELLDAPSMVPKRDPLPLPWEAPPAPAKPTKAPETWTSEDGITVWIPEHIRYSPDLIRIHTTGKSAYLRSQGLTTDVPDNQNLT